MRILIVDDSALIRSILNQILVMENSGLSICGNAKNGQEAIQMVKELNPDLIIMDVNMPIMDGLEATRIIMDENPVPILIFSSEVDANVSFNGLKYGALEVMRKPDIDEFNNPVYYRKFVSNLKELGSVKESYLKKLSSKSSKETAIRAAKRDYQLLVIGASTGGPHAVSVLLKHLPKDFPIGILLVQHLETGFDEGYAQWLNTETNLQVSLAKNNDRIHPGKVLVAPVDKHLVLCGRQSVCLEDSEKVLNQKPSVDVLFQSAAKVLQKEVIGVLLTGMGQDGARGCVAIKEKGGYTIVQDKESSAIFGMPKAAIEMDGASKIVALDEIPAFIMGLLGK